MERIPAKANKQTDSRQSKQRDLRAWESAPFGTEEVVGLWCCLLQWQPGPCLGSRAAGAVDQGTAAAALVASYGGGRAHLAWPVPSRLRALQETRSTQEAASRRGGRAHRLHPCHLPPRLRGSF